MSEHMLGFNERRFLELYRRFYREPYPAADDNNQNAHVKGQKAVYLLMLKQVGVGDYGFTWQQYGPCSDTLQEMMRNLDKKPEAVEDFYQSFPMDDPSSNKKLYSDNLDAQRLFCLRDAEKIDAARENFNLPEADGAPNTDGDTHVRRWVELLGSLAYIAVTRLPGASEERVWEELQKAKSKTKYLNAPEKEAALQVLRASALLSGIKA